jgi:glycosyltransferase involved in cell wall biosynthesis
MSATSSPADPSPSRCMPLQKVSVIALTCNQPAALSLLLAALGEQVDPPPFEVVVTDDGSSCDNAGIVARAAGRHGLDIRYVWQPDRGFRAARARNNGIRQSSGDLLLFLDGDIVVTPTFLRSHFALHDGSKKVVCGRRRHVLPGGCDLDRYDDELLRCLGEHSREADPAQAFWSTGAHPWMSLNSFAFSAPRNNDLVFDEEMEGWGSEDRELALRLFHRHGYQFLLPPDLEPVFHLLSPGFSVHHEKIVSGIKNKLYLITRYDPQTVAPALEVMRSWRLDPNTDRWTSSNQRRPESIAQILAEARDWFARHG